MFPRVFLILAGLFAGLWLGGNDATVLSVGYAALAVTALLIGIAAGAAPGEDGRRHAEEAFVAWITAWQRLRTAAPNDRAAALTELRSRDAGVALLGNDRVVKALQAAVRQRYATGAVAAVVMDMRRAMRRAGVSVRSTDIEGIFAEPGVTERAGERRPSAAQERDVRGTAK